MADDAKPADEDALPVFDKLWNYREPAATEAKFRELLPRARAAGNTDYLGQLLTQIARTRGLQQDFEGSHKLLDEAESVLGRDDHEGWVRVWLERGRAHNSNQAKDKARPFFLKAFARAHRHELDVRTVDAVHMLAIASEGEDSVTWNDLAIDLAERAKDARAKKWLGSLYNNQGWSYHDKGDFEGALGYWEKALVWHAEHGSTHTHRIAKWAVARGLRSLERHEDALAKQQALLAEYVADDAEKEAGFTHEEIAKNLWALGRKDDARPHFRKAHAFLGENAWLKKDEPERLARLKRLGEGEDA